jgi:hypothetical protein
MPGMMVPMARMDPVAWTSANSLPYSNAAPGDPASFSYDNKPPSSGTVVFDDSHLLNVFGNFLSIPYAPYLASRNAGFKLYIDGKSIDSQTVAYSLPTPAPGK